MKEDCCKEYCDCNKEGLKICDSCGCSETKPDKKERKRK